MEILQHNTVQNNANDLNIMIVISVLVPYLSEKKHIYDQKTWFSSDLGLAPLSYVTAGLMGSGGGGGGTAGCACTFVSDVDGGWGGSWPGDGIGLTSTTCFLYQKAK